MVNCWPGFVGLDSERIPENDCGIATSGVPLESQTKPGPKSPKPTINHQLSNNTFENKKNIHP